MQQPYAFVDGNSFKKNIGAILADFGCAFDQINWQALTRNAARIFYFDALPSKRPNQSQDEFDRILREKADFFLEATSRAEHACP